VLGIEIRRTSLPNKDQCSPNFFARIPGRNLPT
jgi:hypothetical protein